MKLLNENIEVHASVTSVHGLECHRWPGGGGCSTRAAVFRGGGLHHTLPSLVTRRVPIVSRLSLVDAGSFILIILAILSGVAAAWPYTLFVVWKSLSVTVR